MYWAYVWFILSFNIMCNLKEYKFVKCSLQSQFNYNILLQFVSDNIIKQIQIQDRSKCASIFFWDLFYYVKFYLRSFMNEA